jgi:GMP synthase-like glutamine amidotransferase
LGSIETWLRAREARITTTRFYEDPGLPDIDAVDLLIVMGGPMSVNDDGRYPWLAAERQFIRDAIERNVAVIGVCLGAQLIARAMGARVYPNREREIGWFPVTGLSTVSRGPAWAAAGAETTVFHWHGDTFDLPPAATHLARSVACEHQAFQLDGRVIGIQFHLETTRAGAREMVAHCGADLAPSRFVQSEADMLSADDARFVTINGLMMETLNAISGAEAIPKPISHDPMAWRRS